MFVSKGVSKISVVLPISVIWSRPHLREKTVKFAEILRSCCIFRVHTLFLFNDTSKKAKEEASLIATYLLAPPYLKKYFPHTSLLRYVGVAPPIKTPLHTVSDNPESALSEPLRVGRVVSCDERVCLLDVGFKTPLPLIQKKKFSVGDLVYVKVVKTRNSYALREIEAKHELVYLGPQLVFLDRVSDLRAKDFVLVELTRKGEDFPKLSQSLPRKNTLVFLGSQEKDPSELYNLNFHYKINVIPKQGVETVRSEEALLIGLSLLSWHLE
jgi:predicted SPOUT superfamily RNA methylase MTH1